MAARIAGTGAPTLGDLAIDCEERRATLAGQPLELTGTEYELLRELATNAGLVLSHQVLLPGVWHEGDSSDFRPVRVSIKRLRSKREDRAEHPTCTLDARGAGCRLAKPDQG